MVRRRHLTLGHAGQPITWISIILMLIAIVDPRQALAIETLAILFLAQVPHLTAADECELHPPPGFLLIRRVFAVNGGSESGISALAQIQNLVKGETNIVSKITIR